MAENKERFLIYAGLGIAGLAASTLLLTKFSPGSTSKIRYSSSLLQRRRSSRLPKTSEGLSKPFCCRSLHSTTK